MTTKDQAQQHRDRAVQAVKDAQAACGKAIGPIERDRAKAWLATAHKELVEAKAELRACNLAAAGAKPLDAKSDESDNASAPRRKLTTQELSVVLLESFQQLMIADPGHAAIRTLREHFLEERLKNLPPPAPKPLRLPPREPVPLRRAGKNFLDSERRQASGPGTVLYPKHNG
jgi:hypothetical protein